MANSMGLSAFAANSAGLFAPGLTGYLDSKQYEPFPLYDEQYGTKWP